MHRRLAASLLVLAAFSACQSTQVPPARDGSTALEEDESRLWHRVAEEQDNLDRSRFVVAWPELDAYLSGILARLHPGPLPGGAVPRIRVIVDPTLNAFALPNGALYIHTGLIARLDNEAQLATVIAHEITHATHRHGLRSYRNIKNETAFLATFTVGTGGVGGLLGGLGVMASVSGYSKDLEREADRVGFDLLTRAGYDPRESIQAFRHLLAESKRSQIKEPFFFGSHPRLEERIASFEQLVAALPPARRHGVIAAESYAAILPLVLVTNGDAALRAGDFDFARDNAERALALRPGDARASLVLAEVFRKRDRSGDAASALRLYLDLTTAHPDLPEAQRGLGLMLFKKGEKPAAAVAFRRYLAARPRATDRLYIESFLSQCETKS